MTDYSELKRLAEAFPADLDWDSCTEPFFNGPSGESLGGGPTGFYCVFGQPFEIDFDTYDGNEYVSTCTKEFAKFICSARAAVLALIAENERLTYKVELRDKSSELYRYQVDQKESKIRGNFGTIDSLADERDQLKAEVEALRKVVGDVITQHPRPSRDGNAPGHCHLVPGIWGRGNGGKSGTECDWCKTWNAAIAISKESGQ